MNDKAWENEMKTACLDWQVFNFGVGLPIRAREAFEAGARWVGCNEESLASAQFNEAECKEVSDSFIAGAKWARAQQS